MIIHLTKNHLILVSLWSRSTLLKFIDPVITWWHPSTAKNSCLWEGTGLEKLNEEGDVVY